jgi:hypothetical protein
VHLNVLVICICYFARFLYDLFRACWKDEFQILRRDSLDPDNHYYFSIFLFGLIFVVEYLPILMFTLNIKFISSNSINVRPRAIPVIRVDHNLGQKLLDEERISRKDHRSVLSDDVYD